MASPKFSQAMHTLKLIDDQNPSDDDVLILHDGYLADLVKAIKQWTVPPREGFQRAIGLLPPEPPLNFIIRVDHSVKPSYPDWMKKKDGVMHPELEAIGPVEYDLQTVLQWLANGQENVVKGNHVNVVKGNRVYAQLKKENALENCLGLANLLAIQ